MVKVFKASKSSKAVGKKVTVEIERLDINGLGVGKYQGKPVFVPETCQGEQVSIKLLEQNSKYAKGKLLNVLRASEQRIVPQCTHYRQCGGCDLQHISIEAQRAFKAQKITDLFARQGIVGLPWQPAIFERPWQYRRKARIGVQYNKLDQPIIGFRKTQSNEITPIKSCPVLEDSLCDIFKPLNEAISELSATRSVGHVEVIATNNKVTLVIRQLVTLPEQDEALWELKAQVHGWQLFIDDGKQIQALSTQQSATGEALADNQLHYDLNKDLRIQFRTSDFIQVNQSVNKLMVAQAINWLELSPTDKVLDLFCGLGNFSLAIASSAAKVVGVEGVSSMTKQAQFNADKNNLNNCQFHHADLNDDWQKQAWSNEAFDKILLDPARAGAFEACEQILKFNAKAIVYVSCDPATLARDSKVLIDGGYQVSKIALIDMFSQTKHVETMVLFRLK